MNHLRIVLINYSMIIIITLILDMAIYVQFYKMLFFGKCLYFKIIINVMYICIYFEVVNIYKKFRYFYDFITMT